LRLCAKMLSLGMDNSQQTPACCTSLNARFDPEVFRALGDAVRLTLIGWLANAPRPQTVTEVSSCCGVHLSGVSRHLKTLRDAGIVRAEKEGREVRYTLDCGGLAANLRAIASALDECKAACHAEEAT
jgi:DNA-binding transcriptional ArsR family regulator